MALKWVINPMNWFRAFSVLSTVWDACVLAYNKFKEWQLKRAQAKVTDQLKSAEEKIDQSNKITDPNERLKQKAEAANEIENSIHPKP